MSIPAHARGKARESRVQRPLDEIQVDTVPNPEPIDGIELIISTMPGTNRQPRSIQHICSDAGTEFRSDTFRKWCSENKIHFNSAAPKTSRTKWSSRKTLGNDCKTC